MLAENKQRYADYCVLAAIFIFSRIVFLLFTPFSYYEEEGRIGSIGHDIVFEHGLRLPFWGYLDSPHGGGSIFAGLTAIPFYVIFGDRYLSLKLAALTFSLLTVLLWYRLLSRETNGSRSTFILSMVLFTFATPHYVQKSVVLVGNTVELMFFSIAIISYFWAIRNAAARNRSYVLLGALCGFAFWVQFMSSYLFFVIIVTLFITHRMKTALTRTGLLMVGFLLGAFPLWIYNLQYQWATITSDSRLPVHIIQHGDKLKDFFLIELPASFHFLDIGAIKAQYPGFVLCGIVGAALLIHLGTSLAENFRKNSGKNDGERIKVSLELFLIIYLVVFVAVISFTSFPVDGVPGLHGWNSMNVHNEYYIVSLQLILFVLLISLGKYKHRIALVLPVVAGIVFVVGYCSLFRTSYFNISLFRPMHATNANAHEAGFNYVSKPELFLEFLRSVPDDLRRGYFRGARELWGYLSPEKKNKLLERAEKLGPAYIEQYRKL